MNSTRRSPRTVIAAGVVLGLTAAVLAGCDATGSEGGGEERTEYVIGGVEPLTGSAAQFGDSAVAGGNIAVDEINAAGGINGIPLRISWEDGQLDNQVSVAATQKLIQEGVPAVITSGGSVVLAQIPIAEQNEIVLLNMAASTPSLQGASDWLINTIPTSGLELRRIAELAINDLGAKTAAVLEVDNDTGKQGGAAFIEGFEKAGGEIVAVEVYPVGATDMKAQLLRIKNSNPDAVIVTGNIDEIGQAALQMRQLDIDAQQLGYTITLGPQALELAAGAMDGLVGIGTVFRPDPTNTLSEQFAKTFAEQNGGASPSVYSVLTYDTVKLVAAAIGAVGYDATEIRDYMIKMKDFPGAMGAITIGAGNTAEFDLFTYTIKNGKAEPYTG